MSSPIAIPRSNKATTSSASSSYSSVASSSSSPATSYHSSPNTQAKYVPIHKRSPSPSHSPKVDSYTQTPAPSRTYSIHHLLSLRAHAHAHGYTDSIKATLRAGPAPELVMNRKMRKNLEFAEHHHRRVSPTSSVNVSPVSETAALPPVVVAPAQTPIPTMTTTTNVKSESGDVNHSWNTKTKFSGRASHPHPHQTKRQPLGGLQSNLANWRTPVPPRLAVN